LTDSEKFNEWMEEMDYDLEATSAQKRKIQHEEPDSKKSKEDLKAEDYKISVIIPSHATWFSMEEIHSIEKRSLPEFFDSKSTTKTPEMFVFKFHSKFKL
jgi:SWI/SNF related-matrix-associated actin-dependent regulator of chromatin subfamily C